MIITRCPACSTAFRVSAEQLALRNGRVRCGHCYRPFDARSHRIADDTVLPPVIQSKRAIEPRPAPPPASPPAPPVSAPEPQQPAQGNAPPPQEPVRSPLSELPDLDFTVPDLPSWSEPDTWVDTDPRTELKWKAVDDTLSADTAGHRWRSNEAPAVPAPAETEDEQAAAPEPPATEPETAAEAPGALQEDVEGWRERAYASPVRPLRHRWLWALGTGILLGILAAQASYIWREPITREWPQLRPLYLEACARLGCSVPLPRIAGLIVIERSNLEFSTPASRQYELQAVVHNRAPHPQQVPHIELTLTDLSDQPLVRRALTPAEWLPKTHNAEDGLAAGARVEFTLPFRAREINGVTGFRVVAFYP